jgi:flagellar motility protein MotE (MotC chaperone)
MIGVLIRLLRDLRLVPVVLIATIALFALKALGLVLDGGYLFDGLAAGHDDMEITGTIAAPRPERLPRKQPPAAPKSSWAQEMFNYPGVTGPVRTTPSPPRPDAPRASIPSQSRPDITGSAEAKPSPPKDEAPKGEAQKGEAQPKKPQEPPPVANGTTVPLDLDHPVSPAERAILESLQKRRAELDARARELDIREDLLRAAEKRVGGRIEELKDLEARVDAALAQKDDGEAARFKNVVTMYENMKPKDAAKIFDGLDMKVLLDVARDLNPRKMSDILAQMAPENAQRLTVELAVRSAQKDPSPAELPKIQGKPTPN